MDVFGRCPNEWRDNTTIVIDTLAHPYFNWIRKEFYND
jgi:hypothetical protein